MGSRGAADSIGEDRLLELSSRDVLWPEAIACSVASVVGLHLVLGALSLQGSRTSSHVQKGFIPEERLRRRQVRPPVGTSLLVASSGVHAQLPGLRPSEVSSDLLNWVPALFVKLHKRRHLDRGTSRTHSGAQTCKAIHHSRFHRRTDGLYESQSRSPKGSSQLDRSVPVTHPRSLHPG